MKKNAITVLCCIYDLGELVRAVRVSFIELLLASILYLT